MPVIDIDIRLEGGQLREYIRRQADYTLMVDRLNDILKGPNDALRKGVVQVLTDQFNNADSHPPIIIRTGTDPADVAAGIQADEIHWTCDLDSFAVDIDLYPASTHTPHGNPNDPDIYQFP